MSLLRHGIPLTLLLDLVRMPDSRALLEGERVRIPTPTRREPGAVLDGLSS